jgi:hypothetical protein
VFLGTLILETSDSSLSNEEMVDGHRFQSGHSTFTELVAGEMHMTAIRNYGSSPEHWRDAHDSNKKLWFFAGEEVGFKQCAPAAGGERH